MKFSMLPIWLLFIHTNGKASTTEAAEAQLLPSAKRLTQKTMLRDIFEDVDDRLPFPDYADGNCSDVDSVMSVNLGYYQSWAKWRDDSCFPVRAADIDVIGNGYTHLAYTFASINATFHLEPWASNYAGEIPLYEEFNALKETYPGLRTLIAVGGWTFSDPGETEYRFSDTALTAESRKVFAESCVDFCRRYNFDGIDLDWEFPGYIEHGGRVEDYETFPLLVQEIRNAFNEAGMEDWILTVATPVSKKRLSGGYNLPLLVHAVDFFHLMTYNIFTHYQASRKIGANTDMKAIFGSIRYYNKQGVSPDKIVMGLAAFGRTFQLQDPTCDTKGCYFSGPGEGGCAGSDGFMPYFNINEYIQSGNYKSVRFNPMTLTMELVVNDYLYISYDDYDTFAIKFDYASMSCLRGVMWWAVDMINEPISIGFSPPTDENASQNPSSISPTALFVPPSESPTMPKQYDTESPVILLTDSPVASPVLTMPTSSPFAEISPISIETSPTTPIGIASTSLGPSLGSMNDSPIYITDIPIVEVNGGTEAPRTAAPSLLVAPVQSVTTSPQEKSSKPFPHALSHSPTLAPIPAPIPAPIIEETNSPVTDPLPAPIPEVSKSPFVPPVPAPIPILTSLTSRPSSNPTKLNDPSLPTRPTGLTIQSIEAFPSGGVQQCSLLSVQAGIFWSTSVILLLYLL